MDCSHQLVESAPLVAAHAENDQMKRQKEIDQSQQEFYIANDDKIKSDVEPLSQDIKDKPVKQVICNS